MFSFGKNKTEARITGEFYANAIHVMEGASLLSEGDASESSTSTVPQCGQGMDPAAFKVFTNYVAMPLSEAFRIEYWALEEAKIRRQPAEKGIEPLHRTGCWRRQWHWSRGGAARSNARCPRDDR